MKRRLAGLVLLAMALSACTDRGYHRAPALPSSTPEAAPRIETPSAELRAVCDSATNLVKATLHLAVQRQDGEFNDSQRGTRRLGCRLTGEGSFATLANPSGPVAALEKGFTDHGWRGDIRYMADGPDGSAIGLRRLDMLCLVTGSWDGGDDSEDDPEPAAVADPRYQATIECARDVASNSDAGVPDSLWRIASAAGLDTIYAISGRLQYPPYLDGDFDGDGVSDAAVLVEQRATGKLGVAMVNRVTRKVMVLGAGAAGAGPEDLSWIDRWDTFRKGASVNLTIGDRPRLPLLADAVWVGRQDSLSGFYLWTGANYVWEPHRLQNTH